LARRRVRTPRPTRSASDRSSCVLLGVQLKPSGELSLTLSLTRTHTHTHTHTAPVAVGQRPEQLQREREFFIDNRPKGVGSFL